MKLKLAVYHVSPFVPSCGTLIANVPSNGTFVASNVRIQEITPKAGILTLHQSHGLATRPINRVGA